MSRETISLPIRLGGLPVAAKVMLTTFLLLIAAGYLVAVVNIHQHNQDADLEPGMSLNDLRRVYHGLEKPVSADASPVHSSMLKMVLPGGAMRKHLEKGGETAVRSLITWLQAGAKKEDFSREGASRPGDPSAEDVIGENCVRCHNSRNGEKKDTPYAATRTSAPEYDLVAKVAAPPRALEGEGGVVKLEPMGFAQLVQSTHAHILAIPVFVLAVGCLFFLTGQRPAVKAVLGPLPMLAIVLDIGGWWLSRPFEPFIYVVAAAGGIFGGSLALQIACVLGSMWLGDRGKAKPAAVVDAEGTLVGRSSTR